MITLGSRRLLEFRVRLHTIASSRTFEAVPWGCSDLRLSSFELRVSRFAGGVCQLLVMGDRRSRKCCHALVGGIDRN